MFGVNPVFLATLAMLVCLAACTSKPKEDLARSTQVRIDSMEKSLLGRLDSSAARAANAAPPEDELPQVLELVKQYQLFSVDFRHDTATPRYLMKEAQLFGNYLQDRPQAIKVYQNLVDSFPQAHNRPSALFFLASTQHDIGDTAAAQVTLRRLMKDHPGTGAAKMAPQFAEFIRHGIPNLPKP
jgi:TolA-binding protein